MKLPAPHFVIFYNGVEERPPRQELKLSDLYIGPENEHDSEIWLELRALMLNINPGKNDKLLNSCKSLKEYMLYTERVRAYRQEMPLRDAVIRAVDECIRENILSEFLRNNKAEVIVISIFEYDEQGVKEVWREEAMEEGIQEGIRLTKEAMKLSLEGRSVEEISLELNVSEERVKKMLE